MNRGDFGLVSGRTTDGSYEQVWFKELVAPEEVAFEAGVFLLRKVAAEALKAGAPLQPVPLPEPPPGPEPVPPPTPRPEPVPGAPTRTVRLVGNVPAKIWNRLGTKILPKLRSGSDLKVGVDFGQRRKRRQPGVGAAARSTRTRTGQRGEGRVARLPPSALGAAQ